MFDDHDDEVMGHPSFELLICDGRPRVSGCYFMHPPIEVEQAAWDPATPGRLLVTASDGSIWYADDIPSVGRVNVILQPRR